MMRSGHTATSIEKWRKSRVGLVLAVIAIAMAPLFVSAANPDTLQLSVEPKDQWPPMAVTNLSALAEGRPEGQVDLTWTAPTEDDDPTFPPRPVDGYYIKAATFSVQSLGGNTTAWWDAAGYVDPGPGLEPGNNEQATINFGVAALGTTQYFAIKSYDDASPPNVSPIDEKATPPYPPEQAWCVVPDWPPWTPTGLAGTPGERMVTLTWTELPPEGETLDFWYYSIWRSTDSGAVGDLVEVATSAWQVAGWEDTNLNPATSYYYAIRAVDQPPCILASALSPAVTVWISEEDTIPPAAITSLAGTRDGCTEGQLRLTWSAPGDDGWSLKISTGQFAVKWSSAAPPISWSTTTANVVWEIHDVEPHSAQSYLVDLGKQWGGTTFYFRIWTADEIPNWSALSNGCTAWLQTDVTPPDVVTDLRAWDIGSSSITLAWTSPGDDGLEGDISSGTWTFRVSGVEPFNYPGSASPGETVYQPALPGHFELTTDTTYLFEVNILDESGNGSGYTSPPLPVKTRDILPPQAITDLAAGRVGCDEGGLRLTWTTSGDNGIANTIYGGEFRIQYSSYVVVWSTAGTAGAQMIVISTSVVNPGEGRTRFISGLTGGVTYYFSMWTRDEINTWVEQGTPRSGANWSALSNLTSAWAEADFTPPAKITDLKAEALSAKPHCWSTLKLAWTAPGDDGNAGQAESYDVRYASYQWTATSSTEPAWGSALQAVGEPLPAPAGSSEEFYLAGLQHNTSYWIAIVTYDDQHNVSLVSNFATAVTVRKTIKPLPPCGVKVSVGAKDQVTLSWSAVEYNTDGSKAEDIDGYRVYRAGLIDAPEKDWVLVGTTASNTLTWKETGDVEGTLYFYKLRTIDNMPISPVESDDSVIADNSTNANIIVLSDDHNAKLTIPREVNSVLYKDTNKHKEDILFTVKQISLTDSRDVSGYEFHAYGASAGPALASGAVQRKGASEPLHDFTFDKAAAVISITYDVDLSDPTNNLALFRHNGIEWVKIGGKVDSTRKEVRTFARLIGRYMVRQSARATEFTILNVIPKIITPNGDGVNDYVQIIYEKPVGSNVSITGKIYDIRGAYVNFMAEGNISSNTSGSLMWDGTYDKGGVVPSGVYIYQIEVGGKVHNGTVVVAR